MKHPYPEGGHCVNESVRRAFPSEYPKMIFRISRQLEIAVSSLYVSIPAPMSSATSLMHEELRHNTLVCRLFWKGMPFYYDVAI